MEKHTEKQIEKEVEERVASAIKNDSSLDAGRMGRVIAVLDPVRERGDRNMMGEGATLRQVFGLSNTEASNYLIAYLRG